MVARLAPILSFLRLLIIVIGALQFGVFGPGRQAAPELPSGAAKWPDYLHLDYPAEITILAPKHAFAGLGKRSPLSEPLVVLRRPREPNNLPLHVQWLEPLPAFLPPKRLLARPPQARAPPLA